MLALVLENIAQVVVRLGPIGPVRQGTPDALHAGLMFAALTCDDPQQVPRMVVMRVSREGPAGKSARPRTGPPGGAGGREPMLQES